jgi:hypothetical protein
VREAEAKLKGPYFYRRRSRKSRRISILWHLSCFPALSMLVILFIFDVQSRHVSGKKCHLKEIVMAFQLN